MFTKEFLEVLKQIIKSWQVIAAAVAVLLYINIVSYVSRSYHPPRRPREKKIKMKAEKTEPVPDAVQEEDESNSNDELGLEEA
ncbi:MAG: hypothetical protein LBV17_09975 [Treponema sp.]|jgi:hypothetical protein|nr:hypothetical protein [Treponema sp.]